MVGEPLASLRQALRRLLEQVVERAGPLLPDPDGVPPYPEECLRWEHDPACSPALSRLDWQRQLLAGLRLWQQREESERAAARRSGRGLVCSPLSHEQFREYLRRDRGSRSATLSVMPRTSIAGMRGGPLGGVTLCSEQRRGWRLRAAGQGFRSEPGRRSNSGAWCRRRPA
ncbi:hypothetical protein [Thermogemmatispora sp.]|uniref:hypothetical protein n=1 Tax=Thermogemmatispora sp. TaxID=1968838 RepID=UPI001D2FFC1D|nr:hypothetical protein [Thermogemmatispora sp.]MBX5449853.1 hypothetical protein [Thermogemmatispora sp.]